MEEQRRFQMRRHFVNELRHRLGRISPATDLDNLGRMLELVGERLDRLPDVKGIYPLNAVLKNAERFTRVELSQFDQGTATMPSLVKGAQVPQFKLPIRSLQKFETEAKEAASKLEAAEMILAVRYGDDARAYPIREMAYHHVLNDVVEGIPAAVTY